jgi:hypothetical protein
MSRPLRRRARIALTAAAVALLSIACAPSASPSQAPSGSAPTASAPASAAPSAAASADLEPIDVDAAIADQASLAGTRVAIRGFLLVEPASARLCGLVLESYPPQCGGSVIAVRGGVPPAILDQLESTFDEPTLNQAAWGDVIVTGVLTADGGSPILDIDGIVVVDPR